MNKLKYPLITLITIFVSAASLFAQSPELENKSSFCFKKGDYIIDELHDQEGNKYFTLRVSSNTYFNGDLLFTPENAGEVKILVVKTTIKNEYLWSKSFPLWFNNQRVTPYLINNGMVLLSGNTTKGDFSFDGLPKITNDEKVISYLIRVDSTGNDIGLFPLTKNLDGLPVTYGPYGTNISYVGDTIVVSGSVNANARFGGNDVLVSHQNFRASLYIARYTTDGDFIDIDFVCHAGNMSQNYKGLTVIGNKAYCYFNFTDTLRWEQDESIISLPLKTEMTDAVQDAGLLCYDLDNKEVVWLKTFVSGGSLTPLQMLDWGDNIMVRFMPYASVFFIGDSTFTSQVYSNICLSFDKETGELKNSFSIDTENNNSSILLNVESSSSLFLSSAFIEGYLRINNSDKLIDSYDKGYFFRINDDNTYEFLGESDISSTMSTNKDGILTLMIGGAPNDVFSIFGTELEMGPCTDNDLISMVVVDLSYLNGEKMGVKGLNSSSSLISIYPNPASNKINIEIQSANKPYSIIDVQGRTLQKGILENTKTELDLSKFSNGIYFIKIENDVRKIIIN